MASYYPGADEDLSVVARTLIDLADDPNQVHYFPGSPGPQGRFDVPDEIAEQYLVVRDKARKSAAATLAKDAKAKEKADAATTKAESDAADVEVDANTTEVRRGRRRAVAPTEETDEE